MSRETAFNLEQFTPGAIAAMKANPAAMKAIHAATHGGKLFPSRPGSESADADDDSDTSEHSDLGMAADLINCEVSGESGPGCGHNCDHVARATECLQNYSRDEAMRKRNRDDAGKKQTHSSFLAKSASVRFA